MTFRGNDCEGETKDRTPLTAKGQILCPDGKWPWRVPSKTPLQDAKHKFGIATNFFMPSFKAKSIRLYPKTWGKAPMLSVEFFVGVSLFDWTSVKDDQLRKLECDSLFAATSNAFKTWSQGLNGDNFVWRSDAKKINHDESKTIEFVAYRKSAIRSRNCGSLTKEMICYRTEDARENENCCMRKTSTPLCKEWSEQASETRLF